MQLWLYGLIFTAIVFAFVKLLKLCQYGKPRNTPNAAQTTTPQQRPQNSSVYTIDGFVPVDPDSNSARVQESENQSSPPPYDSLIDLSTPPAYEPPPAYDEISFVTLMGLKSQNIDSE